MAGIGRRSHGSFGSPSEARINAFFGPREAILGHIGTLEKASDIVSRVGGLLETDWKDYVTQTKDKY